MNNKLLGMIKKNPMLYDVLLVFKHRKDKDFLRQIQGLRTNANIVEFVDMPNAVSGDGILCDIEIDAPNDGFFALVRWALDALYFCDCFSLKPFIKFSQNNQRVYGDRPAPTIAASFQSNFIHPHLNRNFTAREGARLQSFPDDFVFEGMRTKMSWEKGLSQYQQIGNAVPVLLAYSIAQTLSNQLKLIK